VSAINRMLVVVCLFLLSSLGIRGSADARTSGCPPRPQEMPCLIASPAAGPVGTTVDVHGHIGSKFAWWRRAVKATPFIELDREFPDGCGGEGGTRSDTIRIAADGTVTGSFVVTSPEHCFQTDHYHPTTPGLYSIVAGCLACENGTFRVTAGATGALASTGWSSGDAIALAAIMTLGGLCCLPLARRRRTTN
jgi:hypothetical protein